VSYWIADRSWGTEWSMEGYFYIQFGQCAFEAGAISGDYTQ
jgi:C1A family cysteine protease